MDFSANELTVITRRWLASISLLFLGDAFKRIGLIRVQWLVRIRRWLIS
jgi:hypothetical protein